ncbi:hypothetical protein THAOC_29018 [Thalassiosira oceanica]|uniref:Uncharacterized protein n=1 Tax=Thalassiosira oceanica TaxID=159749 RepID=K0RYR1_THAOC|nr:hypothetical protein THAOC_29018 [Thalassiosira oceanica]|eukprot:EJK51782.1 hypothetical protein THAOC_29018 [Thalassiosira oceanica]
MTSGDACRELPFYLGVMGSPETEPQYGGSLALILSSFVPASSRRPRPSIERPPRSRRHSRVRKNEAEDWSKGVRAPPLTSQGRCRRPQGAGLSFGSFSFGCAPRANPDGLPDCGAPLLCRDAGPATSSTTRTNSGNLAPYLAGPPRPQALLALSRIAHLQAALRLDRQARLGLRLVALFAGRQVVSQRIFGAVRGLDDIHRADQVVFVRSLIMAFRFVFPRSLILVQLKRVNINTKHHTREASAEAQRYRRYGLAAFIRVGTPSSEHKPSDIPNAAVTNRRRTIMDANDSAKKRKAASELPLSGNDDPPPPNVLLSDKLSLADLNMLVDQRVEDALEAKKTHELISRVDGLRRDNEELLLRCESLEKTIQVLTEEENWTYSAPNVPRSHWIEQGHDDGYARNADELIQSIKETTEYLRLGGRGEVYICCKDIESLILSDTILNPHWEELANALQLIGCIDVLYLANVQLDVANSPEGIEESVRQKGID